MKSTILKNKVYNRYNFNIIYQDFIGIGIIIRIIIRIFSLTNVFIFIKILK